MLRQNRIPVLSIATYVTDADNPISWGAFPLAREIAKITGGRCCELPMIPSPFQKRASLKKLEQIISEAVSEEFLARTLASPIPQR